MARFITFSLLIGLMFVLASACVSDRTSADTLALNSDVDAAEIIAAYEGGDVPSNANYLGRRVRISGYLADIQEVEGRRLAVSIRPSMSTRRSLRCTIAERDAGFLQERSVGDPVSVTGVVIGPDRTGRFISIEECTGF